MKFYLPGSGKSIKRGIWTAVLMLTGLSIPNLQASTIFEYEGNSYRIIDEENHLGEVALVGWDREATDAVIPSTIEFEGQTYTVTTLDRHSIAGCNKLNSIVLPNTLITIEKEAIWDCGFFGGLIEITIPASVELIKTPNFFNCRNLQNIFVEEGNKNYFSQDGVLYDESTIIAYPMGKNNTEYTISEGVETIAEDAFYASNLEIVNFPESLKYIKDRAFNSNVNLNNPEFPKTLQRIERYAFSNCPSITDIFIPENVEFIGPQAFIGCELKEFTVSQENPYLVYEDDVLYNKEKTQLLIYMGLQPVNYFSVPEGVESISEDAFYLNSYIEEIYLPDTVKEIGTEAFAFMENLRNINLPSSLKKISDGLFYKCWNLRGIKIPEGVTEIGEDAFGECSDLYTVELPSTLIKIGKMAFRDCDSFFEIEIPASVVDIEEMAFNDSGLMRVIVPASVTEIKRGVFGNCELQEVELLGNITLIDEYAFTFGEYLQFTCMSLEPPVCKNPWDVIPEESVLYVPSLSVNLYKEAEYWNMFTTIEGIGGPDYIYQATVNPPAGEYTSDQLRKIEISWLDNSPIEKTDSELNVTIDSKALEYGNEVKLINNNTVLSIDIDEAYLVGGQTFSIKVPEGYVSIDGTYLNGPLQIDYSVLEDAGVSGFEIDANDTFDVYNLNGIKLRENVDTNAINSLSKGVYIIRCGEKSLRIRIK